MAPPRNKNCAKCGIELTDENRIWGQCRECKNHQQRAHYLATEFVGRSSATHCSKCGALLVEANRRPDRATCVDCRKRQQLDNYYAKREHRLACVKRWRENNRERRNVYKRAYSKQQLEVAKRDPVALAELREKRRVARRRWENGLKERGEYAALRDKRSAYENKRRKIDLQRWVGTILRTQVWHALRRQSGAKKSARTMELVGCSIHDLVRHLEAQFEPAMSWQNFGKGAGKWSIDHIKPCASFDLADPEQQKKAFHYTNLRPMWFSENCAKNSHWAGRKWSHADHACQSPESAHSPA